ncbi:hypothetical protein ZIOFF_039085 [Zingiber officinale]|uniref:Ferredoxin-thioredoxin reductase catalytic chain, chloroplastic n=1 Tax=Zingiber officinale TaxID=94328 RepID=A0A8J5G475_ZINOF|nr:hypothetical protein ZIOFF_039085 [Zingiber officinale]
MFDLLEGMPVSSRNAPLHGVTLLPSRKLSSLRYCRSRRLKVRAQEEPSEKSVEIMRKFSEQYAVRSETFFCVDKGVTSVVIKSSTPLRLFPNNRRRLLPRSATSSTFPSLAQSNTASDEEMSKSKLQGTRFSSAFSPSISSTRSSYLDFCPTAVTSDKEDVGVAAWEKEDVKMSALLPGRKKMSPLLPGRRRCRRGCLGEEDVGKIGHEGEEQ